MGMFNEKKKKGEDNERGKKRKGERMWEKKREEIEGEREGRESRRAK